MLKVGIIGIGNAGNQVAELAFTSKKIDGIAINSSEKDVSTIKHIESIVIGDEKGAGKDRNIAKDFMKKHIKELLKVPQFKSVLDANEVIYVISSTGGGTGSGMSPVLSDVLGRLYPDKRFILIGILPPVTESVAAQQNTIDYLKEMRSTNPVYMLYDNNNYKQLSTSEMLLAVNKEIVEDVAVIRGDYQLETPYNSIDEKDMFKIIETAGRLVIGRVTHLTEKNVDEKSIEDRLISSIHKSAHTELERDRIVKRLGVISNLSQKISKVFDGNLPNFKELIGEPIEGFEHISLNEKEENYLYAILSGLSVPDDRIEKILQRIQEATDQLTKVKSSSLLDDADTDLLELLRGGEEKDKSKEIDDLDLDDIFNNYTKK